MSVSWEEISRGSGGPGADRGEVLESALHLLSRGFAIIDGPGVAWGACGCRAGAGCASPGKHPRGGWGVKDRRTLSRAEAMWVWDPDRVKGDFITPNLFVVAYLSQLVIADVDDWEKFSGLGLELPPTLTAVSGSGRGLHLYYKKPWGMRGPVPRLVRSTLPEGTGEVRWTGVVAAPPSAHKSGSRYAWANPGAAVADAPSWLGAVKTTNAVRPPLLRTGEVDDVWAMRMREAWIADARGLAHLADLGDGRRQRPVKSFAAAARGGQLVHWGILNAEGAMRILFDAATSNGWVEDAGADEVLRQIRNGLETGRLDALEGPMTEEDLDDE